MPPRGGYGRGPGRGPGMGPGMGGYMGGIPRDSTMGTANQIYDFIKTTSMPPGVARAGGYVKPSGFSFRDIFNRIGLAWDLSFDSKGRTRIGSFIGNFQYLSRNEAKYARFIRMVGELDSRHQKGEIEDELYGQRVMYEAMDYYGFMLRSTVIDEDTYRKNVEEFAASKGIDFSWGSPSMGR